MLRARHGWNWGQLRRHLRGPDGRWRIAADGVEYFRISLGVTVSRYTYRGYKVPPHPLHQPIRPRQPNIERPTTVLRLDPPPWAASTPLPTRRLIPAGTPPEHPTQTTPDRLIQLMRSAAVHDRLLS